MQSRWLGYLALLGAAIEAVGCLASLGSGEAGLVGLAGVIAFLVWSLLTGAQQPTKPEAASA